MDWKHNYIHRIVVFHARLGHVTLCSMAESSAVQEIGHSTYLKTCITTLLAQEHFNLPSYRCREVQEFGKTLLSVITTDQDTTVHIISTFYAKLLDLFDEILKKASSAKRYPTQRRGLE